MTELNYEQRNALLARGYNIIDVKVDGKWRYIWPEPLEEKVFALYEQWVDAPIGEGEIGHNSGEIENNLFNACNEIVERWFPNWETYDNAQFSRENPFERESLHLNE